MPQHPTNPQPQAPPPDGLLEGRDFAGRQIQGTRAVQEDSYGVIQRTEFAGAPGDLFLILADGMGGHAAGEVASSLAVNTFADSFLASTTACDAGRLWDCLENANKRIGAEIEARGIAFEGMGTTLLAVLLRGNSARWISVGDSPLYRIRGNALQRLNQIHSRAADLANMVSAGLMTEDDARQDPTRHTLISALIGDRIYEVDDPEPMDLTAGDVLVAATDGLHTLTDREIASLVAMHAAKGAAAAADALLDAVTAKHLPMQDNTSVVVVRIPG